MDNFAVNIWDNFGIVSGVLVGNDNAPLLSLSLIPSGLGLFSLFFGINFWDNSVDNFRDNFEANFGTFSKDNFVAIC